MLNDNTVLTRGRVSNILKAAALAAGIPGASVASHSLRRGGCTTYAQSGKCNDRALAMFGRWHSLAYMLYLFPASEAMTAAQKAAHGVVPSFELI